MLKPQASTPSNQKAKDSNSETSKDGLAYAALLKNELLSAGIEDLKVLQLIHVCVYKCMFVLFIFSKI